ncbi:hypothetical protein BWQ96_00501 [Gracilariopsis chorda]|uniref:Uncharacterized protein n=1 Tax=Gracilariopsis chorda TaxID=448386 RepID=A0A2V3J5N4_9FLOR|nr:hypothetical protein BWQ96_00501 [Gracilariopsis chorda]|eukprot:PXF49623.1 hypothetical protein BWQ96_00501 [Gracilariopsis chorda]
MTFPEKECSAKVAFDWQPRNNMWKLNKFAGHSIKCFGQDMPSAASGISHARNAKQCTAAYTAHQVARTILENAAEDPKISVKSIASLVKAKGIYQRQPPYTHYRAIRRELQRHLTVSRAVGMAALDGYAALLRQQGHMAWIDICDGVEMKALRVKVAKHIFKQTVKGGALPKESVFDLGMVDVSDITDDGMYYSGFVFLLSTAQHFCQKARLITAADTTHCEEIGPQSYGTIFVVVGYHTNNHLVPLAFAHSVGPE